MGSPPPPTSHRAPSPSYSELGSSELEELEAFAEAESSDEEAEDAQERFLDQAALLFPPDRVEEMVRYLKQNGIVHFFAKYVEPHPERTKHLLAALGVLLPRQLVLHREAAGRQLYPLLKTALSRILRNRNRLTQYSTLDDAVRLISTSRRIVVLSGAGISVSCGIPDFRSRDGIYAQLERDGEFELDDPTDMFDKHVFLQNPRLFYSFAHRIFPSNFRPSPSHRFIKLLEERGQLLRNYSQNIDTLEQVAGIRNVIQCHGSFATATCTDPACGYRTNGSEIKDHIFRKQVPDCPRCVERKRKSRDAADEKAAKKKRKVHGNGASGASWKASKRDDESDGEDDEGLAYGIMKPDITFFGEKLSDDFDRALLSDRDSVDLLIVMGTSLKVAPVSELVSHIPHSTPVILINKSPVYHIAMDIMLLGDADGVVEYLCRRLAWTLPDPEPVKAVVGEVETPPMTTMGTGRKKEKEDEGKDKVGKEPECLMGSHVWLFEGAEVGKLPMLLANEESDGEPGPAEGDATEGDASHQADANTTAVTAKVEGNKD
ncbi:NAD-dependent histone deacetylase sir2 [Thecaphora frezii]